METNLEVIHLMTSLLILTMATMVVSDKQKVHYVNFLMSKLNVMNYEERTSIQYRRIFVSKSKVAPGWDNYGTITQQKMEIQLIHTRHLKGKNN